MAPPRSSRDNPDPTLIVTTSRKRIPIMMQRWMRWTLLTLGRQRWITLYPLIAVGSISHKKKEKTVESPGLGLGPGLQARLRGLGLGLGISEAQARSSQAQARASRPSQARNITTYGLTSVSSIFPSTSNVLVELVVSAIRNLSFCIMRMPSQISDGRWYRRIFFLTVMFMQAVHGNAMVPPVLRHWADEYLAHNSVEDSVMQDLRAWHRILTSKNAPVFESHRTAWRYSNRTLKSGGLFRNSTNNADGSSLFGSRAQAAASPFITFA
ncbi:hypothetical protein K438DRAFT_1781781 [Mycena galopus ATCC 62051]|nr:hypothetical protein K438DRAFT_1781781 [Mycena galopus ATCC 62051]